MRGNDRAATNRPRSALRAASVPGGCEIVTVGAKDYELSPSPTWWIAILYEDPSQSVVACLLPLAQVEGAMCSKYSLPFVLLLTPLLAVASPQPRHGRPTTGAGTDATAIAEFTRDVHAYANLHRIVAASMPSEKMYADSEQYQRHINRLAEALRTERAAARVGDVFRPPIASLFKRRLAHAIRRFALRGEMFEPRRAPQDEPRLEVNDAFPWIAQPGMPPAILAALTPLPPGLEYRFVYRDLVLVDVGANLVVDIVENALPLTATRQEVGEPRPAPIGPCDVHPDLPMCWS